MISSFSLCSSFEWQSWFLTRTAPRNGKLKRSHGWLNCLLKGVVFLAISQIVFHNVKPHLINSHPGALKERLFVIQSKKGRTYICSMEDLSSHEEQIDSALLLYVHGRWEKWRGKVRTSEKEEDEMHVMHSVLQHQGLAGCMLSVYILIIIISFYYVHTRCKGAFTRIDYQ